MLGGLGRVSSNKVISGIASLYVEVVRGIPVLVWLLWIWFALPQLLQALGGFLVNFAPAIGNWMLEIRLDPYSAAILGFTFAYGAYMTEVFRAGIQSIPKGQMEAARSLGMNYIQAMRYIVLPQAIQVIVPPVSNEFVTLLKDSSLVSILAVSDLTRRGREYVARTFLSFDTFTMVALLYLILTVFFTRISSAHGTTNGGGTEGDEVGGSMADKIIQMKNVQQMVWPGARPERRQRGRGRRRGAGHHRSQRLGQVHHAAQHQSPRDRQLG